MEAEPLITYGILSKITETVVADFNRLLPQMTDNPDVMTVARMEEILDAGTKILIAEVDGRIVGTASVLILRQMRWYKAWLEDIVVDQDYRRRGIARRLVEMSAPIARDAGCQNLNLTSKPGREDAWEMYKSLGYKQRDTRVFRLDL